MKLLTVIGARPQFIKSAIVSRCIDEPDSRFGIEEVLVHTGQHYDHNMSRLFFDELDMRPPDYNLGVQGGSHGAMTGEMLEKLDALMRREQPDQVLVYGDTNSTLAGALAAAKLGIRLAHVEAGLRSFNRAMPEEINRVLTDHCADFLFAPTIQAVTNLQREGIEGNRVFLSGDVMYDAALYYGEKAENTSRILESHGLQRGEYILSTIHRAENTNDPDCLKSIMDALVRLAHEHTVVLPLHPRTGSVLRANNLDYSAYENLHLIEPVGYLDMLMLEKNARAVVTDSGGVQKEAFFFRVPCITVRQETEWTELVDLGWNRLARPAPGFDLVSVVDQAVSSSGGNGQPYGDGNSSEYILGELLDS